MKQKIFIALCALALAVLVHGYLTWEYYPLHFGMSVGKSICNVSAKFDCDAVSASRYSALFGVPIAVWGGLFNGVLFLLVLATWLGLRRHDERGWRDCFWLASGSLLASLVMGSISTFVLDSFCLFCIATYGLSLVAFLALWSALTESPWSHLRRDWMSWFTEDRAFLLWPAAIVLAVPITHLAIVQNYGAQELDKVVKSTLLDWQGEAPVTFNVPPSLTKGASPEQAKMVITEFADFRCGHCRAAAPSLAAFVKSHADVRLMFYTYPLDGSCNPVIERGDGISCRLAKAVVCAQRQEMGWAAHDLIFENQPAFQHLSSVEATDNEIKTRFASLGADLNALESCLKDPAVDELVKAQAAQGEQVKVNGTPTIFVNGRRLERGQIIAVLSAVHETLNR